MGPLVNKGEVYQHYYFNGETVTRNAQINAFFEITELSKLKH